MHFKRSKFNFTHVEKHISAEQLFNGAERNVSLKGFGKEPNIFPPYSLNYIAYFSKSSISFFITIKIEFFYFHQVMVSIGSVFNQNTSVTILDILKIIQNLIKTSVY